MAFIKTDSQHYTNIATKIREKTGGGETYTPSEMPDGVESVYKAGKKAEYDHFWDVFQQNGKRTAYQIAFCGFRSTGNFYPKYDIAPQDNASGMMQFFGVDGSEPIDLAARLEECGVKLDTSKATNLQQAFFWRLGITRLPEISMVSATNMNSVIASNNYLHTVDKVIFSSDGSQPSSNTVISANPNLQNITIEGVIGKSINLGSSSKLSAESIKSFITHLKDYKGTDDEFLNKLTLHSECWERLEADSTAPDGGTWKNYVTYTLCWNT